MTKVCETRNKLLKAAAELIWRSSYHATGVDAICRACKVQKGSFYHHFASKEELTLAVLESIWQHHKQTMDEAFSPVLPPLERFKRYLDDSASAQRAIHQQFGMVCGCPIFSLGSEIGTREPALRKRTDEILRAMTRYFSSAIRDGQADGSMGPGDPQELANMILTYSEGALTMGRIRNDLAPIRAMADGVMRILGIPASGKKAA